MNKIKTSSAKLQIHQVAVKDLNPAPYNPRKWENGAIKQLTESIEQFGLIDPIIVNKAKNRKNVVIGGHFRLKIAKNLNYKEVPVVFVDIPNIEKEKEFNLRLNRNTGEWDIDLLKEFDVNMLLDIGFDDSDLSQIWDEALSVDEDEFDVQEEIDKISEPQSQEGDIYQLRNHYLICGDSTNSEILNKLLGKTKIDMIYSDPPFNLNYNYQKGLGKKNKYKCDKVDDNLSEQEYHKFLEETLQNALLHTKENAHVFYWCDQKYIGLLQNLYRKNDIENKRVCLWIKNNQNATPNVAFNKCYEPCVYGTIGKPYLSEKSSNFTEIMNSEIDTGNRSIDDILDLLDIWMVKRLPTSDYLHPTEKPVSLHEKPLRRCTKIGDNVLDLFGGSGSTLIACEQLGRNAFLVEKDARFCDVIIERFKKFSPHKNVKRIN